MPTDVSGTINIIAEVVGNSSSPVTGTGNSSLGKPKKEESLLKTLQGVLKSSQKMVAILGIGGLLASSKIISGTMGSIMRIFGTFMDMIIGPIAPLLVRGLVILATVVMWIRKLITGESAWSDAWAGLKQWWIDTWNEKGGLWGIFTEGLQNVTGAVLIAALFASIVATPMAGMWVMRQFIGTGTFILKKALKGALGLGKFLVKAPFKLLKWVSFGVKQGFKFAAWTSRGLLNIAPKFVPLAKTAAQKLITLAAYTGRALFNLLPAVAQRPLLYAASLLNKMFTKAAIFTKSIIRNMVGFAKWGASAAKVVAGWSWTAIMFGGSAVKIGAVKLIGMLGLTGLFSAAGSALLGIGAALAIPALLGILIVGVGVGTWFLADLLFKRAFGYSRKEAWSLMDRVDLDQSLAPEVYVPLSKDRMEGMSLWERFVEIMGQNQFSQNIGEYTAGEYLKNNGMPPDPAADGP